MQPLLSLVPLLQDSFEAADGDSDEDDSDEDSDVAEEDDEDEQNPNEAEDEAYMKRLNREAAKMSVRPFRELTA